MEKDNSTKVKRIERASNFLIDIKLHRATGKGFPLPIFQLDIKLHRATGDANEEEQRQLVGTSITKVGSDKKKYQKILRPSMFKLI